MIQKKKMYLFTDYYPWGKGEKSFIEPELDKFREFYEIVIISIAPEGAFLDEASKSELPVGVEAVYWKRPHFFAFAMHALGYPFSPIARQDFARIKTEGFSISRVLDSIKTYGVSRALLSFYRKMGIFEKADVTFYSFWFNYQLLALAFEKRHRPIRLVSRIHGYDLYNSRNRHGRQSFQWFKKEMTDLIIFASSNAMYEFEKEFGPESHSGQYVTNRLGVPAQEGCAEKGDSERKLILSCSNVIPLKRVDMIARAIAASSHKDEICWVHFGDGECLDDVRNLAARLGLNASFFGHVRNDYVIDYYKKNQVDVVILLSESEGGCPVCFQEALSFGVPLIGTNVGGVSEEIDGNGVLLDSHPSLGEVAAAIDKICFAPEADIRHWRKRSEEIWNERFNAEANKLELIDILSSTE